MTVHGMAGAVSSRVSRVFTDDRPGDLGQESLGSEAYAVFERGIPPDTDRFLGLVPNRMSSRHPTRIFADLLDKPAPPAISEDTALEDVLKIMDARNLDALSVIDRDTQSFLGAVTRTSLLSALLKRQGDLVRESRFLKVVAERESRRLDAAARQNQEWYRSARDLLKTLGRQEGSERDFLEEGLHALARMLDARYGAIGVLDEAGKMVQFLHSGLTEEEAARIGKLPEGRGLLGLVIKENRSIRLEDLTQHPESHGFPPNHPPMKSLLAVPIAHRGEAFGRIYLSEKRSGEPFTEDDQALAHGFSGAVALELAQRRELDRRRKTEIDLGSKTVQLEAIAAALTTFLRTQQCAEACAMLLSAARDHLASPDAVIAVRQEDSAMRLLLRSPAPLTSPDGPGAASPASPELGEVLDDRERRLCSLLRRVLLDARPVIVNQPTAETAGGPPREDSARISRFLGVPFFQEGRAIGVVAVMNRSDEYTEGDANGVQIFVDAVGMLYDGELRRARESCLETDLRQAQKMDAVGKLAGGIAHDFNNLLTVILGYGQMALNRLESTDPASEDMQEVVKSAVRASDLTRRLLTFSRRQDAKPTLLDLNAVIANMDGMLRLLMDKDIKICVTGAPNLWPVKADLPQLEQAILNVCLNARDAMPNGGIIRLQTENIVLTPEYASPETGAPPGRYVLLSIADNGVGMPPEILERIFEPFFTTKEPGRGTGLGLSTTYGSLRQSGGHIRVSSEIGKGTTFRLYFPRAEADVGERTQGSTRTKADHGTETVLIVEDDQEIRKIARAVLEPRGYKVMEAPDGESAMRILQESTGPIDLLLIDVIMPGLSGTDLAKTAAKLRPSTKIMLMSGYPGDALFQPGELPSEIRFLQKPFTIEGLARMARETLDAIGTTPPSEEV